MTLIRKSLLTTAAFGLLGLAACNEESSLPRNGRHYVAVSMETQQAMRDKNMRTHAPIVIRAFKKESELEVWKQDTSGKLALLKTFPMCRWSGQLGPKTREGDRQVPEGFYAITQGAMNPNSNFYLSFNVGYPNQLDRQLGRTGGLIMVHGDCSSMGCYAMTDNQVADIYALTREAFAGGQTQIQMQSYPFRMTAENLAKYRSDPHMPFWKNLKQGNDHFEVTKKETKVAVCGGKYAFGTDGNCAADPAQADIRTAVAAKNRTDEIEVAELVSKGTRPVKRLYRDGDMHPTFKDAILANASRAVGTTRNGISRTDALAFTPIELPVEQYQSHKSKGRSAMQIAELAQQELENGKITPTVAEPAKATPAKVEIAKIEPAKTELAKPAATTSAPATATVAKSGTAVAAVAAPSPVTALAPAQSDAPQASVFQRVLTGVGLGSTAEAKSDDTRLEENAPQRVTVPLPPRRQASAPIVGPQASAPVSKLPDIIGDTQRLAPSSLAGFSKLP
jgi:murein L,D-transpeptidase YafK